MGGKAALILVAGFAIILMRIAYNMNNLETSAVENVSMYLENTVSHNLALAGANVALSMIYTNPNLRGVVTDPTTFTSGPFVGGKYTARMDSVDPSRLLLRTVSTYEGLHDTVDVSFKTRLSQSFSMFAWMTNFEGNVFWITGDTVWGRIHSNGMIHVDGSPVFWEKVTTAKRFDPRPGVGTNRAIFKNGYETGIAEIPFPNDLSELVGASSYGGKRYTSEIWLTLSPGSGENNDGKVYVRNSSSGPIIDSVTLADPSFNGVIVGNQRVHVKGTLDGKLTIASIQDVYIEDNVFYERNPMTGYSDDLLGLVAENNVVVADNAANNDNCEIHAAIFSRSSKFTAENYNTRPVSGALRLLGSIVQDERGEVGTFSGSKIKSGFSKRYRYDNRLLDPTVRPPYFPGFYTQTLQISGWWESFRLPKF
ncbi:MAG: hypothetical protein WBW16_09480 [Bacteroidota bacterium]